MTPYRASLWSQAPAEATHWVNGDWFPSEASHDWAEETDEVHERPVAYQSPAQLIEAYRKEHGAEIEAHVNEFLEFEPHYPLDKALDDALFQFILLEKHLAAERARIEEQSP